MTEQQSQADAAEDPTDPCERAAQTFPRLSEEQARRVAGSIHRFLNPGDA